MHNGRGSVLARLIDMNSGVRFVLSTAVAMAALIFCSTALAAPGVFDLDAALAEAEALKAEGEWRDAGAFIETAFEAAVAANATDEALITLLDEGSDILLNLDDLVAAAKFGERALAALGERGNGLGIARAQILLAQTFYWSDRFEEAKTLAQTIIDSARRGDFEDADALTTAVAFLGRAYFQDSEYDKSIEAMEAFIDEEDAFAAASKDPRFTALRQLALSYRNKASEAGRPALEKALEYARQAADVLLEEGDGADLNYPVALETVARIEWMLDLRTESIAHLREAVSQLEAGGAATTRDYVLMTAYLCDRLTKTGATEEAVRWGEIASGAARDIFMERYRGPNGASQNDRIFLRFATTNYLRALRARADKAGGASHDDLSDAFAAAQLISISGASDALSVTAAEIREHSPALRRLTGRSREIRSRIDEIDVSVSLFSTDPRKFASQLDSLRREKETLADRLHRLQQQIKDADPLFHDLWDGALADLETLQSHITADEAFIQLAGDAAAVAGSIHLFVVTREDVVWRQTDFESGEVCELVSGLRRALSQLTTVDCYGVISIKSEPAIAKFDPGAAYRLYQLAFGAAEDVLRRKKRWTIAAEGLLLSMPVSALLVEAPPADFNSRLRYSELAWLGARHAVLLAPSAASLIAFRSLRAESRPRIAQPLRIAATGAPCLGRYDSPECFELMERDFALSGKSRQTPGFRNLTPEMVASQSLSELPGAYAEIKEIKGFFPDADISMIGPKFRKTEFIARAWENFDILSLSTHAIQLASDARTEAAIVFSPSAAQKEEVDKDRESILRSSEIAALSIPVDWAILSSCNTIAGGETQADAIAGLALAFMQAGAEAIVLSTFEVRDDASNAIVPGMLDAYAKNPGAGKAEALRLAIEEILADPSRRDLHHPSAWAPFAVMGAGQ